MTSEGIGSKQQANRTRHVVSGHLNTEFLVELDCLGRSFKSSIHGRSVEIVIPDRDADPSERNLLPPAVLADKYREPPSPELRWFWGSLTNTLECMFGAQFRGHDEVEMAKIRRVGITTQIKTRDVITSRALSNIMNGVDVWYGYAGTWLQIFAARHINSLETRRIPGDGPGLSLWIDEDSERIGGKIGPIGYPEHSWVPLTKQEVEASFHLAGLRADPPLEWILIRDAQYLVRDGKYRRAIIDAGTASELAITRMIDRKLRKQGHTTTQIEAILGQQGNRTLGGRKALLQRLNAGTLPRRFSAIVINPRNAAAHEGAEFRRIDAERAVLKAKRVVDKAVRLQDLFPKSAS